MRHNKIFAVPESSQAVCRGVLVKDTDKMSTGKVGSIWMPDSDRKDIEKDGAEPVEFGEVVSVGGEVSELKPGDLVVYRRIMAYGMPNGIDPTFLWKIEYPHSILCVVRENA